MKFITLSLFPEFFEKALNFSLFKRAIKNELIYLENLNIKTWGKKSGKNFIQVDDKPYGGGAGMILMIEPVYRAIKELKHENKDLNPKVIIFSPKGILYNQKLANELAQEKCLILICPRYEGFDERILNFVDLEISIGNFILSNGDLAALILIDSVSRLIPGFVGNKDSLKEESFSKFTEQDISLEYPQYTRPARFVTDDGREYNVPDVLLSGDHAKIQKWRDEHTLKIKKKK